MSRAVDLQAILDASDSDDSSTSSGLLIAAPQKRYQPQQQHQQRYQSSTNRRSTVNTYEYSRDDVKQQQPHEMMMMVEDHDDDPLPPHVDFNLSTTSQLTECTYQQQHPPPHTQLSSHGQTSFSSQQQQGGGGTNRGGGGDHHLPTSPQARNASMVNNSNSNMTPKQRDLDLERILRETESEDDLTAEEHSDDDEDDHNHHHRHHRRHDDDDDGNQKNHYRDDNIPMDEMETDTMSRSTISTHRSSTRGEMPFVSPLGAGGASTVGNNHHTTTIGKKQTRNDGSISAYDNERYDDGDDDDEDDVRGGITSADSNFGAHNSRDWAVLQAILTEHDSDHDDDHHLHNSIEKQASRPVYASPGRTSKPNRSSGSRGSRPSSSGLDYRGSNDNKKGIGNMDVDAILQSMDVDHDDDVDDLFPSDKEDEFMSADAVLTDTMGATTSVDHGKTSRGRSQPDQSSSSLNHATKLNKTKMINPSDITKQKTQQRSSSITNRSSSSITNITSTTTSSTSPGGMTTIEESITSAALSRAETYERRLLRPSTRDIVSPLMVKRRMKPKIELQTRIRKAHTEKEMTLEHNTSINNTNTNTPSNNPYYNSQYYTSNQPRYNFAGILKSKSMASISLEMKRTSLKNPSVGLPTALAVNSKFIAIGSQGGLILVFDLFEQLRQKLGSGGSNTNTTNTNRHADSSNNRDVGVGGGAVTSIDIFHHNETLVAGYASGIIVLWDILKGTILKSIMDAHPSPITSVRFINSYNAGNNTTTLVSVDAGGLVNKLTFHKSVLWGALSVENECLLDGTAGQILSFCVLPPISTLSKESKEYYKNHPCRKIVLIALSSERSSFAVAVEPSVNVLHRWARPERLNQSNEEEGVEISSNPNHHDGDDDGVKQDKDNPLPTIETTNNINNDYLPCLAWGWALISGEGSIVTPILARAWGTTFQLLRASFIDNHGSNASSSSTGGGGDEMLWPAFGIHDEFDAGAPVVAVNWIGERSLVYLTITNEFTVIDTVCMTLLERLDFSTIPLVYAEFASSFTGTTFSNSMRCSDNRLLILCQEEVKAVSLLSTRDRILGLEESGEWLEALAFALDHYENTVKLLEDRRRDPSGKKDLSKHPHFMQIEGNMRIGEDEAWIADLLMRYLKLAVENAPEGSSSAHIHSSGGGGLDLAQSHFQMLAGVCIEFCVVTRRLDLLFGPIFTRFQRVGYIKVFFDVLEPYVLNDKLHHIAPEAMSQFVEHCKASNDVATVERCLLHMDVTIMDFDSILALLRKNGMYSALLHVFAHGLNDFVTPLEILLEGIFDAADECDLYATRRLDGVPQNAFEQYGYKALLYLKYCFTGRTFPQHKLLQPEERIQTLRPQLLHFLLQPSYTPSPSVARSKGLTELQAVSQKVMANQRNTFNQPMLLNSRRRVPYPYLNILVLVDAKALLDALSLVLDATEADFEQEPTQSTASTTNDWQIDLRTNPKPSSPKICPNRQRIVSILSSIIQPMQDDNNTTTTTATSRQAQTTKNAFLDFCARYLQKGVISAPKPITFKVLHRMSHTTSKLPSARKSAQDKVMKLLIALPSNAYDRNEVLTIIEKSHMNRAALLLHKSGASWGIAGSDEAITGRIHWQTHIHHFVRAIECYVEDQDPDFQREVFDYIKKEYVRANMMDGNGSSDKSNSSSGARLLRQTLLKKLKDLIQLDPVLSAQLVAELFMDDLDEVLNGLMLDQQIQFQLLQAIISGDLTKIDSVAGPVLHSNLSMDHHQMYLTLMAKFHPDLVYHHLINNDNYRPDECLKLCQQYDIADASAYLLERMGNVSSALQLMLQTLESRMMTLKRVVRGMTTSTSIVDPKSSSSSSSSNHKWRFSGREKDEAIEKAKRDKEIKGVKQILVVALDLCERNSGHEAAKREHGSQLWFNVLDRLINAKGFLRLAKELPQHAQVVSTVLSELLQLTMQRMVSNVPLPDLVRKITTDHAGNRLGEFREMIMSMLKTYSFELDVCTSAVEVMHQDVKHMSMEKRRLKLQGSEVLTFWGQPLGHGKFSTGLGGGGNNQTAIILIGSNRDAQIQQEGTNSNHMLLPTHKNEVATAAALSRLRRKRNMRRSHMDCVSQRNNSTTSSSRVRGRTRSSLNIMTSADQEFCRGGVVSDLAGLGPRQVGVLPDAEHFGKFGVMG